MNTLIFFAVLHGAVSISPIRTFQPFPDVKCPPGYSMWWPAGKEFENDKYAQCVKPIEKQPAKATGAVSQRRKNARRSMALVTRQDPQ
jgi:hypothetical protein